MNIIYFGNFTNTVARTIDTEIVSSLKNHKVKQFDIKKFEMKELLRDAAKADLFLFHGMIIAQDEISYMMMIERLKVILMNVTCKKVMWFMDKVWGMKGQIVDKLLPHIDEAYFTDGTWVRRVKDKVSFLPPAHTSLTGKFKKELECDIAYVASLYGNRQDEFSFLKETFGERLKFYDDKYGQDLADLCASTKIMIVPRFPFDDFFWSDRVYEYMNNGTFVIHPRCQGLADEGFKDGVHYMTYNSDSEIVSIAIEMLNNEKLRTEIAQNGKRFVKNITYKSRLKKILK